MHNISFSPPDIREEDILAVSEVLRSGWITTGPRTKEFEREIANYCHTSRAVALNSATAALELTLRMLGIGPGDEVIVPAYTYTASASVVTHVGATLVMIDSQPDSLEMDYEQVRRAITPRTKAVIAVDLAGIPCDYDSLFSIVNDLRSLFRPASALQQAIGRMAIISDGAHALGSTWHGKQVGEIADFTAFSFHAVKNLTTAEGGAITWTDKSGINNDDLYKQFQLFSLHGQDKDALAKTRLGAWEYDIIAPNYKCNMTDIMAALGLSQFKRYSALLQRRAQIIRRYNEAFETLPITPLPHFTNDHQSSGHLYIIRLNGSEISYRNRIIEQMAEHGIATNVHYKPLPMMSAYKNLGFDIKNYPNAFAHYQGAITLPLHTLLTDEEVEYIIHTFTKIIKGSDD